MIYFIYHEQLPELAMIYFIYHEQLLDFKRLDYKLVNEFVQS